MRKCIVTTKHYEPPTGGSAPTPGRWVDNPPCEGIFHRFVEEDHDGVRLAMAVVEHAGGILGTYPLYQVVLLPLEHIEGITLTAEPIKLISDGLEAEISDAIRVALHQFTMMCQNLSNRR